MQETTPLLTSRLLENMNSRIIYSICGACVVVFLIIGLGIAISLVGKMDSNLIAQNNSNDCAQLPGNTTSISLSKYFLSQWHWEYTISGMTNTNATFSDSFVRLKCPSVQYDSMLFSGGSLVAYLDGKIASLQSTTYIRDCAGQVTYVVQSGSLFETIINSNKIWVSFVLMDATESTIVAYVAGQYFFTDQINVLNVNGTKIATMSKNYLSYEWYIAQTSGEEQVEMTVLILLAAQRSFSDSNGSTDMCNGFIFDGTIIASVFGAVLFVVLFAFTVDVYWRWRKRRTLPPHIVQYDQYHFPTTVDTY